LRSFVLGSPGHDHRRLMHAFFHHNIAVINSLSSFAWSIEKELLLGALKRVRDVCKSFPLIAMSYYSAPSAASFVESGFPVVVKVSESTEEEARLVLLF
jgi:hypothetical protein